MSRNFNKNNKNLVNLRLVTSDKIWDKNNKRNGKPTIKKDLNVFGRIDKGTSAFITKTNSIGKSHKYVDDTINLPKNMKNKIVNEFKNNNKRVLYLVHDETIKVDNNGKSKRI